MRNCVGELAFGSFIDVLVTTERNSAPEPRSRGIPDALKQFRNSVIMRIKPKPAYPTKRL